VTNYNSAHDTDESNTIDIYYIRNEEGELVRDKSSDSIWSVFRALKNNVLG